MTKKLSICMIVKNEEKNLERCLDSLKPLLERNDIELIIVDTGSTDRTVEIAKVYTENIYFNEWNGNFSDMRNISISYAKGEWIFIIDADEELETPEELMTLIDSEKINNYKTIRIREKNLISTIRNKYIFHVQERLFKNDGTFHYEGTIHNQPIFKQPVLTVDNIWLMHYGYVSEDKDLMKKKFKRTASMLEKELRKDPENVYYRFQLARSYTMYDDHFRAFEEITKAYETMKKQYDDFFDRNYYVYGEYARTSLNVEKYEQVINICKEGLSYEKKYLDLYFYMGHAYLSLEYYEKGIECLITYLHYYEKYNNNQLDFANFFIVEMFSADASAFEQTLSRLIYIIYNENSLIKYVNSLKKNIKLINDNEILKSKLLVKVYFLEHDYHSLVELYKGIKENQRFQFISYMEDLKKDLSEKEQTQMEQIFSNQKDDYGLLNIIRGTNENRNKLIIEFINNFDIIQFPDEIIMEFVNYLIKSNYLVRFFKKESSTTIKKIVNVLMEKENCFDYLLGILQKDFKFSDFQNNRTYIAIANSILLFEIEKNNNIENNTTIYNIFSNYITKGIEYIKDLYNIERIRLTYSTLINKEDKFFVLLYLAHVALDKNDIRNYNKLVLEACEEYPYLSKLLKTFVSNKINLNK